jgi:transcriptional regulator with PAS, ATPase and Fis domain
LPLELLSLREREGDVRLLVHYFLHRHVQRKDKTPMHIDPAAMTVLERYSWPGNVREVENLIERLVVLSDAHPSQ